MTAYKWRFAPSFRRTAFEWKSGTPIQRIKAALTEHKTIAKKEPVLAAEGAVLFLEKLAPAIEQVDISSGGIGSAVNRAIETLVPIIAKADVSRAVREKWLDRLWYACQEDDMPYLEYLGGRAALDARACVEMGRLPVADSGDDVGPLRQQWGVRIFQGHDRLP